MSASTFFIFTYSARGVRISLVKNATTTSEQDMGRWWGAADCYWDICRLSDWKQYANYNTHTTTKHTNKNSFWVVLCIKIQIRYILNGNNQNSHLKCFITTIELFANIAFKMIPVFYRIGFGWGYCPTRNCYI